MKKEQLMNGVIRKIFRYPAADAYMLFACVIAFFALFVSLSLFNEAWDYEADQETYQYRSIYTADLQKQGAVLEPSALVDGIDGNVALDDVSVSIQGEIELTTSAKVYLSQKEEYIYPLLEGQYPKEAGDGLPACVIGKGYADAFHVKTGDKMVIDGEACNVCGIIGLESSEYLDGMLLLWYDALPDATKAHLDLFDELTVVFESNQNAAYDAFRKMDENIQKASANMRLSGKSGYTDETRGRNMQRVAFYIALYVFALLHCVVASDIWAYERKYEVAVKKTYGYTTHLIEADLLAQILRITALAAALCFLAQWVLVKLGMPLLGINLRFSMRNLGLVIGFVFLTALIGIMRPVRSLNSQTSVDSIQRGSDGI